MNFLLISPPGWGKTTSACTGIHPTLIVDVDGKAQEMQNLRPLIDKGDVVVKSFKDRLVEEKMSARALNPDRPPKKQPTGFISVVDFLNDILEDSVDDELGDLSKYNTVVLDSLTRLSEHLKSLLVYLRGQGKFGKKVEDDMNWPSWGSYLKNWEELFVNMCTYFKRNFICTAHMKIVMKKEVVVMPGGLAVEVETLVGYKPLIDGQMREKLSGYFNECYFLDAKTSGKNPTYRFRTRGTKYDARTSLPLDEYEDANISGILKKAGIL